MDKDHINGLRRGVANNRKIIGLPPQEESKPKTKDEFTAMLIKEYGLSERTAALCASDAERYGAFDEEPEEATMNLKWAARELLAVLQRNGNWDDGCFYYNRTSASELQKPMQDLADMVENHD